MTPRPAPKKNALANATVFAPPTPPESVEVPPEMAPKNEEKPASRRGSLHVRGDIDLIERARTAWWNTSAQTGVRSFSEYVLEALREQVERTEAQYNNGEMYEPTSAGTIPVGVR